MRAAVLTVSSSRAFGDDASGAALEAKIEAAGIEVSARGLVTDDKGAIETALRQLVNEADVVITTGGTGITIDDVTPEATRAVIDREIPGIGEALRTASMTHTPMAMLSRGTAGTLGKSLIVNFPGSPQACEQCFDALEPVLEHAIAQLNR